MKSEEQRIEERTAELRKINESLQKEITKRKQVEEKLITASNEWRATFDSARDPIMLINSKMKIIKANLATTKFLLKPFNEILGKTYSQLFWGTDRPPAECLLEKMKRTKKHEEAELYLSERGIWVWASVDPIFDDKGNLIRFVHIIRDITKHKLEEEELAFRNAILSTQQEVSIDGILVVNENHKIISFNRMFVDMWGIPSDVIESRSDESALQSVLDKPADPKQFLDKVRYLYEHRNETSRDEILLKDGRTFDRYSSPMFGADGKYYGRVWYFRDVTEQKRADEELRRRATTDNLTGAYNRTKFEEIIEREIERVKRYNHPLSVIIFDIDYFKKINDTYGHGAGDYVLKTISDIVKENIRKIDYFVRWGGEEFLIISSETYLDKAHALAERIRKITESYKFDNIEKITVSFGVTELKEMDTVDGLIKRADDAMYKAKEKGKNRVEVSV